MKIYESNIESFKKGRIKIVSANSPDEAMDQLVRDCHKLETVMKISCEGSIIYEVATGGWKNRGF